MAYKRTIAGLAAISALLALVAACGERSAPPPAPPAGLPGGTNWVFDHPFFIILNVAVGGGRPGNPNTTTVFPQTMTVDYVRVYQRK